MEIVIKNEDGLSYPLPYKYSKYLVYSSCLMSLTALVALYYDEDITSIYYFLIFLTSINFWRKPEYGLRHKIDKCIVYALSTYLLYNVYLLLNKEFYREMLINLGICIIIFFALEHVLCYFKSTKWIILHMTLHIYVTIAGLFILFIE
jgi:hypothetical protein